MADLGQVYEDDSVERKVMSGGQPLPNGVYTGVCVKTEQKETNNRDGRFLELEYDILSPEQYKGRKIWDRIQFVNPNPKTVEIAKEQLEDLRQAAGIDKLHDDEQLKDAVVQMEVIVEFAKDYKDKTTGEMKKGKDGNRILKYWHQTVNVDAAIADRKGKKPERDESKSWDKAANADIGRQAAAAPKPTGAVPAWKKHAPK